MYINETDAPRKKPYAALRGLVAANDYTFKELAKAIGCSETHINQAMNLKTTWRIDTCYQILDFFRVPHSELSKYFPKDGKAA